MASSACSTVICPTWTGGTRGSKIVPSDLTGTGYSHTRAPFTTARLAAQLLAFLMAMGLTGADAPVLVGHSSGAAVVGLAAVERPDSVTGIMFLDGDGGPVPLPALLGGLLIDPYRTTLLRIGLRSDWLVRHIYSSQCGPSCPPLSSAGLQSLRRPLQQPGTRAVIAFTLRHGIPSLTGTQLDALRSLPVPKSVVFGSADPQYSRPTPAKVATRIGAPAPTIVPGRHLTMISSPQQVASAVRALAARTVP